jgi:hypothetical protein
MATILLSHFFIKRFYVLVLLGVIATMLGRSFANSSGRHVGP